jgi:formylglycine-generating enzyme required for sulfatase activity
MRLPTEAEWEYAARKGNLSPQGKHGDPPSAQSANTWQGSFPHNNTKADGYAGTAPAGCFTANALGLHDMIGNVWEWTSSYYYSRHDLQNKGVTGMDSRQDGVPVHVIKGGSHLCSKNHCARYRPGARLAQETSLGASHIGLRLAADEESIKH